MLTCKQIQPELSDYVDRQTVWWKRWAIRLHLVLCPFCRAAEAGILRTLRLLRRLR